MLSSATSAQRRCCHCAIIRGQGRRRHHRTMFNYLFQDRQSSSSAAGILARARNNTTALPPPARKAATRICFTSDISERKLSLLVGERRRFASTEARSAAEGLNYEGATAASEGAAASEKARPDVQVADLHEFNSFRRRIESLARYQFRDPNYLKAALTAGQMYIGRAKVDNPQAELAIIGDAVFKTCWFANVFPSPRRSRSFDNSFHQLPVLT